MRKEDSTAYFRQKYILFLMSENDVGNNRCRMNDPTVGSLSNSTKMKPKGRISRAKRWAGANTTYLYHYCFWVFCAWGAFYQPIELK